MAKWSPGVKCKRCGGCPTSRDQILQSVAAILTTPPPGREEPPRHHPIKVAGSRGTASAPPDQVAGPRATASTPADILRQDGAMITVHHLNNSRSQPVLWLS